MPLRSLVTPLTTLKVVAAKCSLAVVAGQTALCSRGRVMIQRHGRRHLFSLRHSRFDVVAIATTQLLRRAMPGMTETHLEGWRQLGSARVTTQLMTGSTRRNVVAAGLCPGRVTLIANDVTIGPRRYRKSHPAAIGPVTSRTTDAGHANVTSMLKFDAKTPQRREGFQGPLLDIGMANGANRATRIRKLLGMTTGARQVPAFPRPQWPWGIGLAAVTQQTWQPRVHGIGMREF